MSRYILAGLLALAMLPLVFAHDIWVQTNTNIIRTGDAIHIDLLLGNHGNDHRDFKMAGKVSADAVQRFEVFAPDGKSYDLKPTLVDLGYAPKEGCLSCRFVPGKPGLYIAAQTTDRVVNHGKAVRSVGGSKAFFAVADRLDDVAKNQPGFDRLLGHKLELVPEANPVTPMGPGQPIKLKLLFEGKPLPETKVSFIPRGTTLKEGFDETYERRTDAQGRASFTPKEGNYYLIVAHLDKPDEKGASYESTKYTATLNLFVPEKCPCCDD